MAQAIREVVSSAILFEVADPRVRAVTVLGVEVSGDLRSATVNVSVMGSEPEQARALEGLKHAAGFLQSKVAARLQTRFTPILSFKRDDSVKKSIAMSRLIDETLAADRAAEPSEAPRSSSQDEDEEDEIEHVAESEDEIEHEESEHDET